MKNFLFLIIITPFFSQAQLTIQQIMQNPKWIGTSPSEVFWGYDSKSIYFKWNPEKNISDSSYGYYLKNNKTEKLNYKNAKLFEDIRNGRYNALKTKITFIHNSDVYELNTLTGNTLRITQTADEEENFYYQFVMRIWSVLVVSLCQ